MINYVDIKRRTELLFGVVNPFQDSAVATQHRDYATQRHPMQSVYPIPDRICLSTHHALVKHAVEASQNQLSVKLKRY
jgi:hypothetical protein